MLGSIVGDIIGSRFEGQFKNPIDMNFELFPDRCYFTDDTVLTVAVAEVLLQNKDPFICNNDWKTPFLKYYARYPRAGYGSSFSNWARSANPTPYQSWGNGSAMRVSPIAYFDDDRIIVLNLAERSAEVTHNHEDGIKGASTTAIAILMARQGASKQDIRKYVLDCGYEFPNSANYPLDFDVSCNGTVPQAIQCFLDSTSFEEAIRIAVMSGGDSDTVASIAGAIAEAHYGSIPPEIVLETFKRLPNDMAIVVTEFVQKYINKDFVRPARFSNEARLQELFRSL